MVLYLTLLLAIGAATAQVKEFSQVNREPNNLPLNGEKGETWKRADTTQINDNRLGQMRDNELNRPNTNGLQPNKPNTYDFQKTDQQNTPNSNLDRYNGINRPNTNDLQPNKPNTYDFQKTDQQNTPNSNLDRYNGINRPNTNYLQPNKPNTNEIQRTDLLNTPNSNLGRYNGINPNPTSYRENNYQERFDPEITDNSNEWNEPSYGSTYIDQPKPKQDPRDRKEGYSQNFKYQSESKKMENDHYNTAYDRPLVMPTNTDNYRAWFAESGRMDNGMDLVGSKQFEMVQRRPLVQSDMGTAPQLYSMQDPELGLKQPERRPVRIAVVKKKIPAYSSVMVNEPKFISTGGTQAGQRLQTGTTMPSSVVRMVGQGMPTGSMVSSNMVGPKMNTASPSSPSSGVRMVGQVMPANRQPMMVGERMGSEQWLLNSILPTPW